MFRFSDGCLEYKCLYLKYYYRNLTQRQRELIEEFAKEEQEECDKRRAASASG